MLRATQHSCFTSSTKKNYFQEAGASQEIETRNLQYQAKSESKRERGYCCIHTKKWLKQAIHTEVAQFVNTLMEGKGLKNLIWSRNTNLFSNPFQNKSTVPFKIFTYLLSYSILGWFFFPDTNVSKCFNMSHLLPAFSN